MQNFLQGVATALITPFTKDNRIHFDTLARLIEYQLQNQIDALVLLGTTGEPCSLSIAEKKEIISFAHRQIAGRCKCIVGTGGNNTVKVIEESVIAKNLGADGLLVVTPYYNKCTQNGLIAYYTDIANAVDIPIICYNVPSRTGVNILPQTMEKLAEIPNIVGIKEASGDMGQICETMRRIRNKCQLYSGDDSLNLPILAIGAAGMISVAANLLPKEIKSVYTFLQENKLSKAIALQDALLPLIHTLFCEVNPIPIKAAMSFIGFDVGNPRQPLTPIEREHEAILKNALHTFDIKTKGRSLECI